MRPRTGRFRQEDRLRRSAEFARVMRSGRRAEGTSFVVVVSARPERPDRAEPSRLGITVSRRVGRAVVRNRVKRRIREWFRARRGSLAGSLDVVVIGRASAAALTRTDAEAELSRLALAAQRRDAAEGAT